MVDCLSKTSIGYSHIKNDKPCQDFSASYRDETRAIVAVCDGHGSEIHFRSDRGSRFACEAAISVLKAQKNLLFYKYKKADFLNNVRLNILIEWNRLVDADLEKDPIGIKEIGFLPDAKRQRLKANPNIAYGTTLHAVMVLGTRVLCVSLGDGGIFGVKRDFVDEIFPDDEETVANLTYSMCQEDAYAHMKAEVFDAGTFDTFVLCTDGVVNPYQSMRNFNEQFVMPIVSCFAKGERVAICDFIERLGRELGIGDDVSLGIVSNMASKRSLLNGRSKTQQWLQQEEKYGI